MDPIGERGHAPKELKKIPRRRIDERKLVPLKDMRDSKITKFRMMQQKYGLNKAVNSRNGPFYNQLKKKKEQQKMKETNINKEPDWKKIEPEIEEFVRNYSRSCEMKYFGQGEEKEHYCPCAPQTLSKYLVYLSCQISSR